MFIIGLGDGLGNQMFQYAFYYSMKKAYPQSRILFDDKYFYGSVNVHNGIELERIFSLEVPVCTKRQALGLADYHIEIKKQHPVMSLLWGIRKTISGSKESYLAIDDATSYYKEVYELNPLKSYYLRGNWINSKYFDAYRDELLELYKFPIIDESQNKMYAEEIEKSESVSVHLRAGDYVNNPDLEQLTKDYYDAAIKYIRESIGESIKLFIFSDDKNYAEKKFSFIQNKTIINCNTGLSSYRDMQLMSMCKHNIIANSTFGFWGAYLNKSKKKIVIAPKKASKNCINPFACDDWILI